MNPHPISVPLSKAPTAGAYPVEGWPNLVLALVNPLILASVVAACLLTATFWGYGIIAGAVLCVMLNFFLAFRLQHCRRLAFSNVVLAAAIAASAGIVLAQPALGIEIVRPETMLVLFALTAVLGTLRALAVGLQRIWGGAAPLEHAAGLARRLAGSAALLLITGSAGLQTGIAALAAYGLGQDGFTNSRLLVALAEKTSFVLDERTFARLLMQDEYLWRDLIDVTKANGAKDAGEVVERLMHDSPDQWSGVIPLAEAREQDLGLERNYGFLEGLDNQDQLTVAYVVPGSSASNAGLTRGRRIFSSNGEVVTKGNRRQLLASQANGRLEIAVGDPDSTLHHVELSRGLIRNPAVLPPKVIVEGGKRIGYLFLRTFDTPFDVELRPALEQLKSEKIDELVLDLRYNGGGYEEDAVKLASAIAGEGVRGKIALNESMNKRYAHLKHSVLFETDPAVALNLKRLAVITGKETCSASEALVAMLRPYIDVTLVGGGTCGKPFSMLVRNYGGLSFTVITFALSNADGWGGYVRGLKPDCRARDDLEHALGDPEEESLKAALHLLVSDQGGAPARCPA